MLGWLDGWLETDGIEDGWPLGFVDGAADGWVVMLGDSDGIKDGNPVLVGPMLGWPDG